MSLFSMDSKKKKKKREKEQINQLIGGQYNTLVFLLYFQKEFLKELPWNHVISWLLLYI